MHALTEDHITKSLYWPVKPHQHI